jgi:hypothetical protein
MWCCNCVSPASWAAMSFAANTTVSSKDIKRLLNSKLTNELWEGAGNLNEWRKIHSSSLLGFWWWGRYFSFQSVSFNCYSMLRMPILPHIRWKFWRTKTLHNSSNNIGGFSFGMLHGKCVRVCVMNHLRQNAAVMQHK